MESIVIRAAVIYVIVFIVLRAAGKRTIGEMTSFDLVLLLIISEATQQAMLDDDRSITGGAIAIITLVFIDIMVSLITNKYRMADNIVNGIPVIIFADDKLFYDRMSKARVQLDDILEAARKLHGLESLDQIKYAVLEKDGSISIIPKTYTRPLRGI